MKNVVILDPKGVISKGGNQVLDRHTRYADRLATVTNGEYHLVVVTRTDEPTNELIIKNLTLIGLQIRKPNYLSFVTLAMKSLKNRNIEIFIVGDPWTPFLMAIA